MKGGEEIAKKITERRVILDAEIATATDPKVKSDLMAQRKLFDQVPGSTEFLHQHCADLHIVSKSLKELILGTMLANGVTMKDVVMLETKLADIREHPLNGVDVKYVEVMAIRKEHGDDVTYYVVDDDGKELASMEKGLAGVTYLAQTAGAGKVDFSEAGMQSQGRWNRAAVKAEDAANPQTGKTQSTYTSLGIFATKEDTSEKPEPMQGNVIKH